MKIREVKRADLERCFEIESISYSGDEAATKEKIAKRIETYPEGFVVLEADEQVVGFINSGATDRVQLSDEEFKEMIGHNPLGAHIVIMSVVVHPDFQGKGYAYTLLEAFIEKMRNLNKSSIYLICQTKLISLYAKHGFEYIGASDSDHGGLEWHEMVMKL